MQDWFKLLVNDFISSGITANKTSFAVDWLCQSKGYYRSLESRNRHPSLQVIRRLCVRIRATYSHIHNEYHGKDDIPENVQRALVTLEKWIYNPTVIKILMDDALAS